jgi:peptidoglycan hydrolase-like protein with peptidoglycan-binding domain
MRTNEIKTTGKNNLPDLKVRGSAFFKVQPKLNIGQPGDKYEQEADKMADKLVSQKRGENHSFFGSSDNFFGKSLFALQERSQEEKESVQRQPVEEEEEMVQMQVEEEEEELQAKFPKGFEGPEDEKYAVGQLEEEEEVQAKPTGEIAVAPLAENQIKSSAGKGSKLDVATRAEMEAGFGADFSQVNIHTGLQAVQMNKELGAQAFTHGKDVFFNEGKYNPGSTEGKHLLAHELTHTIQQTGRVPLNLQFTIGDGHDLTAVRFSGNTVLEACYDGERVLQSGATGVAVTLIQQALTDAGFPLPVHGADGIFGSETRQALMNFQRASSLSVDGKVGPATMSALNALFTGGAPSLPPAVPVTPQPTAPPNVTTETIKPAPDGTPGTRTTVGVGERVRLTADTSCTWTVSEGHIIGQSTGANIVWEAPAVAANPTITVTSPGGSRTVSMTVIAPNALTMVVFGSHTIPTGTAGACMVNDVVINPLNVNFGRTQWLEVPGPASNVSGYFNRFTAATLFHNPNPNYLPFNDNNTGLRDHASWHAVPAPFSFGAFDWVIPNRYKIDGETDAQGRFFVNTTQEFVMFTDGSMMIDKAGAFVLRFLNNTVIT